LYVFLTKGFDMDISELKLKIFREIDSLEKNKLQEVYGYLQNFVRGEKDLDDWNLMSSAQKQGILDAIDELNDGQGIPNEKVISKIRKGYSDA
jgi:hypothetical protein